MWINVLIILLILSGLAAWVLLKLRQNPIKGGSAVNADSESLTIDAMQAYVTEVINTFVNTNLYDLGLNAEEMERRKSVMTDMKTALKNCNTGSIPDKIYVKEFIYDVLERNYGLTPKNINQVIPFNDSKALSVQDKFEILMHTYEKDHALDAMTTLIKKYELDVIKNVIEDGETDSYVITEDEICDVYEKENVKLTFEDKFRIIVQRIYQQYKGFGPIDILRDQTIDGLSGGVSGVPENMNSVENEVDLTRNMKEPTQKGYNSIWMFFRGKSIHLSFLTFGSESELKRVCQNVYVYGQPGQLSEAKSFIVNEMKDGSRVVVVRPPFAENWAFFIRKFDLPNLKIERLLSKGTIKNADLAIRYLNYLMKGSQVTAITGDQGSGKTTLLMAIAKNIYGMFNIRTQEMAFELHLRRLYPERNTLALRETDTMSGQDGLDAQRKMDGTVNIVGEVANDPVAAWVIQAAQLASKFTVFSHHAKTMHDLVWSFRNSLLKSGIFTNERTAEQQVVKVIAFNVHMEKEKDGTRYIERITECIMLDQTQNPFDEVLRQLDAGLITPEMARTKAEILHYQQQASSGWEAKNVLEYRNGEYVPVHRPSKQKIELMTKSMTDKDAKEFNEFLDTYWGPEAA